MHRRITTQARVLGLSASLLVAGACAPTDALSPDVDSEARFSQAALDGLAHGIAAIDTSIVAGTELRLYWTEPAANYAMSGRNKVAASPGWTIRDTAVVGRVSASGMYLTLSGKKAGASYVIGKVGPRYDSVLVKVTAPVVAAPQTEAPPTTLGLTSIVAPIAPATMSTAYPSTSGTTHRVAAGDNLQAVFDAAQPGDEIVLANGATFTGNFVLPWKAGDAWIVVRNETQLVAAGTRATPGALASAARIITPNSDAALQTAYAAHNWRLVGFEIGLASGAPLNYGIVVLGRGNETQLGELPSNIVLDRMYVHGAVDGHTRRCIAFNGASLAVIDSWVTECHSQGFDTQGIGGWGGPGPYHIENNRIEASGQAVMFGGADPRIANVSPSDMTIRRNYFFKPLSWAGKWTVKAAFELKHGRRVLFEANVIENHWADAQTGYAILFQTLADDNTSWNWTTVQDVMVRNNIIKNSTSGANVLARVAYNGGMVPSNPTSRVAFVNNLWQNVGRDPITGTAGRIFQLLGDLRDLSIVNNTATLNGSATQCVMFDGDPEQRLTIVNNVFPLSEYGIFGSGKGEGTAALAHYAPGGTFENNVLPEQRDWIYPANNFFPALVASIVFKNAPGDFSLANSNPFYSGTAGLIGVNTATLSSQLVGVVQ